MSEKLSKAQGLLNVVLKFVNSKPVTAIKDGFVLTMPLTIIGSVFLLLAALPIPGYPQFMEGLFGSNWQGPLWQVVGSTFDILALVGVFGIAYYYVTHEGINGVSAGVLGMVALLIVTRSFVEVELKPEDVEGLSIAYTHTVGGVIPKAYLGGKGMIAAIVIGISVGKIYSYIVKNNWTIKLPEMVPTGVANAFTSLIPGFFIILLAFIIFILCEVFGDTSFIEIIYDVVQTPIQGMTDSLLGAILIPVLISLFWWFGIHGATLVMGIMGPIVQANALENQKLMESGVALIAGENAKIVTNQFVDQFITVGGSGLTLGLVVSMVLFSKSKQFKQLGRLSLVPGLFNINEPIIFATPVVFNPFMFVPFIAAPLLSSMMVYFSISVGIIDPFLAVSVPWTTPIIISGFLVGGVKGALLQMIMFVMTVVIYYPFFKYQDTITYKEEQSTGQSES